MKANEVCLFFLFSTAIMDVTELLQDKKTFLLAVESYKTALSNLKTDDKPHLYMEHYLLK